MAYHVEITPAADRQIGKIRNATARNAVLDCIASLAADARPGHARKMDTGRPSDNLWRVDVGHGWRVIYQIIDKRALVLVVKVGDRKEVYRRVSDLHRLLAE